MSIPNEKWFAANLRHVVLQSLIGAFHGVWISILTCLLVAPLLGDYITEIAPYAIWSSILMGGLVAALLSLPNLPHRRAAKSEGAEDIIDKSLNDQAN